MIKVAVKVGLLQLGDQFDAEEREQLVVVQRALRTLAMTLVSFRQVEHTFDRWHASNFMYLTSCTRQFTPDTFNHDPSIGASSPRASPTLSLS
jgi:hypothetical protein